MKVAALAAALLAVASPGLAQTPAPQAAASAATPASAQHAQQVLVRTIDELRQGAPNAAAMTAQLYASVQPQAAAIRQALGSLGKVNQINYLGEQNGATGFQVLFEHGPTEWVLHFDAAGKLDGLGFRPERPQGAAPETPPSH